MSLALTAASLTLVPALTQWPQDRYRLPADWVLFALAAAGVHAAASVLSTPPRPGAKT